MVALAEGLAEVGVSVARYRSEPVRRRGESDVRTVPRWVLALWRRGHGPSLTRYVNDVSIIHVAGQVVPRAPLAPLLISVDDLRPLRDDHGHSDRIEQLRGAVSRGARLVASSYAARREVQRELDLTADQVWVAYPPVAPASTIRTGSALVVSITGMVDLFLTIAPQLRDVCRDRELIVLASDAAANRVERTVPGVRVVRRNDAGNILAVADALMLLSDGARFPSLAISAFALGIPVIATSTDVHRELLEGAATLLEATEPASFVRAAEQALFSDATRSLADAAGRARARDFTLSQSATTYRRLYLDAIQESERT